MMSHATQSPCTQVDTCAEKGCEPAEGQESVLLGKPGLFPLKTVGL